MTCKIKTRVTEVTERQTGKGDAVPILLLDVTEKAEYPAVLAVEFFGKQAEKAEGVAAGDLVAVEFRLDSREWKGRYFTSASGFRCEVVAARAPVAPAEPAEPAADLVGETDEAMPF